MANVDDIKKLREETGAGVADIKSALDEASDDPETSSGQALEKARQILKDKGLEKSAQKANREVKAGIVETYSHGGKVGVLVELLCETDFVGKTDDFKNLAHELALQIASMNPQNLEELLKQEYIRGNSQTIEQLIKSVVGKLGENIQVGRFSRIALSE